MRDMYFEWREGDWVSGRTRNDERFRGYLEWIDFYHGLARTKVVQSDHRYIIGRSVDTLLVTLEPIPAQGLRTETELMALIDLALETRDRSWFSELAGELNEVRGAAGSRPRNNPAFT